MMQGDSHTVERRRIELRRLIDDYEENPTLRVASLHAGDEIGIETLHERLCFRVIDPGVGRVSVTAVAGGRNFADEQCAVHGATWGGSMLWTGRIVVGMNLEISHPRKSASFLFSPVSRFEVRRAGAVVQHSGYSRLRPVEPAQLS
ncbi:MAG TPA: hypothetical protein PLF26_20085 [Blastocatellia bacterium]|nr:hypothetical protein [Blastocatellia bacterium]